MGTQCLGLQLGHPVSGGHKYGDLVLQVGGLGVGLKIQPCKRVIVTKPQKGWPGPELGCRAIWWWWTNYYDSWDWTAWIEKEITTTSGRIDTGHLLRCIRIDSKVREFSVISLCTVIFRTLLTVNVVYRTSYSGVFVVYLNKTGTKTQIVLRLYQINETAFLNIRSFSVYFCEFLICENLLSSHPTYCNKFAGSISQWKFITLTAQYTTVEYSSQHF
jgi:hypothetical protein